MVKLYWCQWADPEGHLYNRQVSNHNKPRQVESHAHIFYDVVNIVSFTIWHWNSVAIVWKAPVVYLRYAPMNNTLPHTLWSFQQLVKQLNQSYQLPACSISLDSQVIVNVALCGSTRHSLRTNQRPQHANIIAHSYIPILNLFGSETEIIREN